MKRLVRYSWRLALTSLVLLGTLGLGTVGGPIDPLTRSRLGIAATGGARDDGLLARAELWRRLFGAGEWTNLGVRCLSVLYQSGWRFVLGGERQATGIALLRHEAERSGRTRQLEPAFPDHFRGFDLTICRWRANVAA